MPKSDADFTCADHGSISILTPVSDAGREWATEHLPDDAMRWGHAGIVVEHRYIGAILLGIESDGLQYVQD